MTLIGLSLSIGGGYGAGGEIPPDTTAPTLTSPTGTATGAEMADLSVSTNEAGGTLYWYVSESATPPSAADLKAGTGAVDAGNQAVTATGAQSFDMTGTAATTYKIAAVHQDRSGNASNVLTGNVTLAAAFSPVWTAFDGIKYLRHSGAIAGAQATTQSFLLAVTHKYAAGTQQNAVNAGVLNLATPSARAVQVDSMGSNRLRAILESSDASNTVLFDGYVAAQTEGVDVEFLTLFAGANDGTNFRMQIRSINLATGVVITTADRTVATSNSVSFADFTACDLLKAPGTYERIMLWDNATADISAEAVRDLFFDHAAGELVDPAVAAAAIGTPLISLFGARLTSGSNAGSGGDWVLS